MRGRRCQMRRALAAAGLTLLAAAAGGCQADTSSSRSAPTPQASTVTPTPTSAPTPAAHPREKKHSHVERVGATPMVAGFTYRTAAATSAQLGKSWHKGCPVAPSRLAAVTMTYWGFDRAAHYGTLIVNRAVLTPVVSAF